MKQVMAEQMIDDTVIATSMAAEWEQIKDSGVLDNMVPNKDQQEAIRNFFVRYFVEVTDLFRFYSAVNSRGGTHTLEYIELCKFITETGILGEEHSNAILKIFLDSHIHNWNGKRAKPTIHSEISRHEFYVALIKIAILKNITLPKKDIAKLRKKGQTISAEKAVIPTVPSALEMIYHDYLYPVLTKMPAGSKMRDAVNSDEVLLLFHSHMSQLSKAFEKYAKFDKNEDGGDEIQRVSSETPTGSMTCRSFGMFGKPLYRYCTLSSSSTSSLAHSHDCSPLSSERCWLSRWRRGDS
jgi:hypothetical protein